MKELLVILMIVLASKEEKLVSISLYEDQNFAGAYKLIYVLIK